MPVVKLNGIVLTTYRYSESSVILKCYTDQFGLQSYMITGIHGKKAAIKPSHLLPLTLLELESYQHQNRTLKRIRELKCTPVLQHIHVDMVKIAITVFMAEVLLKSIHEENESDTGLFGFLYQAIYALDGATGNCANFPASFLLKLSEYLGFSLAVPLLNELSMLSSGITTEMTKLMEAPLEAESQFKFNNSERRMMVDMILKHYQQHIGQFGQLKSVAILKTIFE
ncbi:MAG: DNA repair protein RecO [Bacteroidia bacterium]